jgi:RNA polymerase sigma-32 factor
MARIRTEDDVRFYLSAARRAPELDRELEDTLVRRWQAGDERAKGELARCHQRYVVTQAIKYRHYGIPVGELVAQGNLGVVYALKKFQPERGVRFGTYAAYWVRAEMLALVVKANRIVSGCDGPLRSQIFFKLRRERARVFNQLGSGDDADRELAARLGMTLTRVQAMNERLDTRDVSLDAPAARGHGTQLEQMVAQQDQERELSELQVGAHLRHAVGQALSCLDAREREIVELRQMAEAGQELTLAELARRMGVSRERARQLETRALSKLRRAIAASSDRVVREWVETELTTSAA